ncbi:MAG: cobyric acid synthase [Nitrososphaeraceae archaeon]|jgi:adenosylcobyric acid synthase|nr:cobyric acid synthase [Nitrososphaeraceae archaeon]MDW0142915.1 cobyric acid synthase [Nitrososphaeraceae archaeon]MDW0145934.1 cobyric acid synthase [Nitrososphaeraceae archaeon]
MKAKLLMIQGTSSGAGKSTLVIALCRIFSDMGYKVCPFKAQNMTSNFHLLKEKKSLKRMARIQAVQAMAARTEPDIRMNPVLLKPLGSNLSEIILGGLKNLNMTAEDYYNSFVLQKGFPKVLQDLESLRNENDLILIEGAGSPAEINLSNYDIANMILAEKTNSKVLLVADIERGGCFAAIVGTIKLLPARQRKFVEGVIINKFLGQKSILNKAITSVEKMTKKNVVGIIPKTEFNIPNEDSLDQKRSKSSYSKGYLDEQIDFVASTFRENTDMKYLLNILKMK